MPTNTEATINAFMAAHLRNMHPSWHAVAEQRGAVTKGGQPDIIVTRSLGLPVIIETEFSPALTVDQDARNRLGEGGPDTGLIYEQCLAVRLSKELRTVDQSELSRRILSCDYEYAVHVLDNGDSLRWPAEGWLTGGIESLANCIEVIALSESRVSSGTAILENCVKETAGLIQHEEPEPVLETLGDILHQEPCLQTTLMATAVVANAVMFHRQLAQLYKNISSFDSIKERDGGVLYKQSVLDEWRKILAVNYWPIFAIARSILIQIDDRIAPEILLRMHNMATCLALVGAAEILDLSGRMFQKLITDRKFLATFYTLPTSSTLLSELAVERLDVDWSDPAAVSALRIGDFACGTGALLGAAYQSVATRHRRAGGDDAAIHAAMMENALTGIDIMPAATHLTAAMLGGMHPGATFAGTRIVTAPYGDIGEAGIRIGSLDLVDTDLIRSLFGPEQQVIHGGGNGNSTEIDVESRSMDLVIMNPPFTRPTNHERTDVPVPSFAGFATSIDEQRLMADCLNRTRPRIKSSAGIVAGNGNAGLASNFVDLAHSKLKPGGILALVLPASCLQGGSWSAFRALLTRFYRDIVTVSLSSVGSTDRAFSADTGMAEVLIIATRLSVEEENQMLRDLQANIPGTDRQALCINLFRRPNVLLEAKETAKAISRTLANSPSVAGDIKITDKIPCGNLVPTASASDCFAAAGLRRFEIAATMSRLTANDPSQGLLLPRMTNFINGERLPLARLTELGYRGPVDRDINGENGRGLFITRAWLPDPEFPILWQHNARHETRLVVRPDQMGHPREGCRAKAVEFWNRFATRLHFNRDFQINSQPLSACLTQTQSIGGAAWPNFVLCEPVMDRSEIAQNFNRRPDWEIPVLLWMNTTLGLMSFWWIATRQQQGRARLTVSRTEELTCLDVRRLSEAQLERCDDLFEKVNGEEFLPANEAYRDPVRMELDRSMLVDVLELDETLCGESHLGLLRNLWCREPSVHGGKRTQPTGPQ